MAAAINRRVHYKYTLLFVILFCTVLSCMKFTSIFSDYSSRKENIGISFLFLDCIHKRNLREHISLTSFKE